ncbi:MAG: hypothetical protein HC905_21535 [Bacteroidales bacterium]|nr:hypothetical protein [Bacteroidales bacterium]
MRRTIILIIIIAGIQFSLNSQQFLQDTVKLSEVTVSADKKQQKIRDLPASVTSISIKRIENERVKHYVI